MMAPMAPHAHQEPVKPPDGASTAGTLAPASLSFKDLQSICSNLPTDMKPVPVRESRAAKVLACYGFPGLGHRHRNGDKDNWEHLPHDLLVAVVKHLEPRDAKAMHRVCLSWHLAVRCGLQSMKPTPKLTPFCDVRDYFPRVNSLHLLNFILKAKHLVQLATVTRLQRLSLDNVTLEARNTIQKLTSLQGLRSLEMVNVVGAYPTETEELLNALRGLTALRIQNNTAAVKMAPMHCLASMPFLQELTLSETLHAVLPGLARLSTLTDLHVLRLTKVGVTNGVLRGLSGLTKLHTLHIPDAYRVTDAGLQFISTLTGLTHLDFCSRNNRRDEDVTDAGAEGLSGMTALRSLNLAGHKALTSEGLAFLAACSAMTSLDLSDVVLGQGGCDFLASMQSLRTLSLIRTRLEHEALAAVLGSLTTLTTLKLAWCEVTDETCKELAKMVHITHLDLRYCPLTNAGMARVSHAMLRLEYCNVEGCRLTCLGIVALMRRHKNLRVWGAEQNNLHRFMNVADALLICQVAPGHRRLRVSHFPEASTGLTALVSCGVASFFLLYFGLLLLFFTALFMFPILMLGCIFVALCLAVLGARYTVRNLRRVWLRCDFAISTFLLGQHAPAVAQDHADQHQHGYEEP